MRTLARLAAATVICLSLSNVALGQHPKPPGFEQARQHQLELDKELDQSLPEPVSENQQARKDAQALAASVQAITPELEKLKGGMLANDLGKRLKELEKLSKRLRQELRLH
jgi:hypothetical protein